MTQPRDPDRLYDLLPYVHRARDAERGYPLKALLRVIGEQVKVIEDDIDRLYENWFIETCEGWVVLYIGDLIGYSPVREAGEPGDVGSEEGRLRSRALISRREVASTVALRRRKGSLALLEVLARDVAGWPCRAVELYTQLGMTQPIRHLRMERGRLCDIRLGDALDRLDGPFDEIAHTVDVRATSSLRGPGRHNLPSIGLFVFRLRSYPVTKTQAYCHESTGSAGQSSFTLSILGNDAPLFTAPRREESPTHIAEELDLPVPIRRKAFALNKDAYYGEGKSLQIWVEAAPEPGKSLQRRQHELRLVPVPAEKIVVADLSGWAYRVRGDEVAVDPELGRMAFPSGSPPRGVRVSYHYGLSAEIGGGEYSRRLPEAIGPVRRYEVGPDAFRNVREAVRQWEEESPDRAIIEITTSSVYSQPLSISLREGQHLELRAANRARPVLRILDYEPNAADSFDVVGKEGSSFIMDGVLLMGRGFRIEGPLESVIIRHTTLAPGWDVGRERPAGRPVEPSLELLRIAGEVRIERSIVGPIRAGAAGEPFSLSITDSIIDALDADTDALCGVDPGFARVVLTLKRVTVFGRIAAHALALAESSILLGCVQVARRQQGCVRFCYLPEGSRAPRRHHCQPDMVLAAAKEETESFRQSEAKRVRPVWTSTRYGTPAYAQLAVGCAEEIVRGADDEGSMGAFHDLFEPQRAASLRARLDEFTPAGADAGILYAT